MAQTFWRPLRVLWVAMSLAIVLAGAVALFAASGSWPQNFPDFVRQEVFKSALQVLVVAVAGNLLTLGVQMVLKEREEHIQDENRAAAYRMKQQELAAAALAREQSQLAAQREVRREVFGRILCLYAEAKKIRRLLRAGRDVGRLFDMLNDVQLALETHKKEMRAVPLFTQAATVVAALDSMERYLGDIISECESKGTAEAKLPFSGYPTLSDFTGSYKQSAFRTRFVHAFDEISTVAQAELAGVPVASATHQP
jgi:hypothetical protein